MTNKQKLKKESLTGLVWSGYIGEYEHPPIYIIPKSRKRFPDGIFISDFLKKFLKKNVEITVKVKEVIEKRKNKLYWSKYGSHKKWIKRLGRYIHFCNKCGKYITKDTGCSNPWCPREME